MDQQFLEDYQVEDFITDESFLNYHFNLNEKDRRFWQDWITRNPLKSKLVDEARELIQSLSITLTDSEYKDELNKLKKAMAVKRPEPVFRVLDQDKIAKRSKRRKRSLQYISLIFLVLSAGTFYLVMQPSKKDSVDLNKTISSGAIAMTITLNDSTIVTLAPNSTLQYPILFKGENRQVYLKGEAGFNVKRKEDFPFKVHSANIVTTVLGTVFNIKKQGDSALVVELLSGKLKVEIENSSIATVQPILLYPDEKALYVFHDNQLYKNPAVTVSDIRFQKNSFQEISLSIKKVFGLTVINKSDNRTWRFTGSFKNATAQEVIENICLVKSLKSKVEGDTIIISNK
jgi:transmembrane sensor